MQRAPGPGAKGRPQPITCGFLFFGLVIYTLPEKPNRAKQLAGRGVSHVPLEITLENGSQCFSECLAKGLLRPIVSYLQARCVRQGQRHRCLMDVVCVDRSLTYYQWLAAAAKRNSHHILTHHVITDLSLGQVAFMSRDLQHARPRRDIPKSYPTTVLLRTQ